MQRTEVVVKQAQQRWSNYTYCSSLLLFAGGPDVPLMMTAV